ncbi:MAG: phosphodiester glycosidase family protein [Clostridia bacterium]|nr:phosphodiester glycosidase family protein [Clostridia bacterium]
MKRYIGKLICIGLGVTLLLGAVGCDHGNTEGVQIISGVDGEETIVVAQDPSGGKEQQSLPEGSTGENDSDTEQAQQSTPQPTPGPTRPPMEGDVSVDRFPNYDNGADADWSYQSDELRVAIRRVEDEDDVLVYYVADVWIRNISSVRMAFGQGKFRGYTNGAADPMKFAQREHAIFGVSATMCAGLVIQNGQKYHNVENSNIAYRSGIVLIYRDGSVKTINRAKKETFDYDKEKDRNGGIWQGFQFGPVVLQDGEIPTGLKKNERHPRIIFGYCEPGHYVLVAVDGRTKTSIGMTEQEMGELMQSLGCKDAMNLDGGTSAVMLFMGKTINIPSGKDKDGDGVAGRMIADLLAFAEYDADGNAPDLSLVTPDKVYGE